MSVLRLFCCVMAFSSLSLLVYFAHLLICSLVPLPCVWIGNPLNCCFVWNCVCFVRMYVGAWWITNEEICDGSGPRPVVTSEESLSEVAGSCRSFHVAFEVIISVYLVLIPSIPIEQLLWLQKLYQKERKGIGERVNLIDRRLIGWSPIRNCFWI